MAVMHLTHKLRSARRVPNILAVDGDIGAGSPTNASR
jgi:hypothetical protein